MPNIIAVVAVFEIQAESVAVTAPNANRMRDGLVQREGNTNPDGIGIGGGVGRGPEGYEGHVTFYVEVPDVEASMAKAESLGGTRMMGPEEVMPGLTIGLFTDPESHVIGVIQSG